MITFMSCKVCHLNIKAKELNFKDSENVPIGELEKFNPAIKLRITFHFSRITITSNVLNKL